MRGKPVGRLQAWALLLLAVMTNVHLWTGLVYEQGAFGFELVVKPYPMLDYRFGGGENEAWQRDHPGLPDPWWLRGDYLSLASDDWEEGATAWERTYIHSWLCCFSAWFVLGPWLAARAMVRA